MISPAVTSGSHWSVLLYPLNATHGGVGKGAIGLHSGFSWMWSSL